jgi:hypothetical protein
LPVEEKTPIIKVNKLSIFMITTPLVAIKIDEL